MKDILKTIATIELIGGIIASFISANVMGKDFLSGERSWFLTIIIFVAVLFGSFVSFMILYSIYELLDNQDIILNKLNMAEKESRKMSKSIDKLESMEGK